MIQRRFDSSDKIGDIVAVFPGASNVFKKYDIDFCCGGGRPIGQAIAEKQLDEPAVLGELNTAYAESNRKLSEERDWREAPMSELIDHIVRKHHAYLQKELPIISEFVTKILRVHGPHHGEVLSALHRLFHNLKIELEQHLIAEETVLFPLISEFEKHPNADTLAKAKATIAGLEEEHSGAGDILKKMREITQDYSLPESACQTYAIAFQKLEVLESDLFEHIHLENNILFPRVMNTHV